MVKKIFIACLSCLALTVGCSYGEVSPEAYQYSLALYSVCNRQDEARLAHLQEQVATALESHALSDREAGWLNDIVATAQDGNWKSAASSARSLMEDQIRWP